MEKRSFLVSSTLVLAGFAVLAFNSCTKLAKNLQYDLDMQTASVDITIPPYADTSITVAGSQTTNYNIDSFIKANTGNVLGVSNISSAKLKTCVLTLHGATQTLNFANFKSCSGSLYSASNLDPYTVTIANNPDVYSTSLDLPVDPDKELKGYLANSNQFTYSLGGKLRRPTTDSIHCTATFTFKVHVQG